MQSVRTCRKHTTSLKAFTYLAPPGPLSHPRVFSPQDAVDMVEKLIAEGGRDDKVGRVRVQQASRREPLYPCTPVPTATGTGNPVPLNAKHSHWLPKAFSLVTDVLVVIWQGITNRVLNEAIRERKCKGGKQHGSYGAF